MSNDTGFGLSDEPLADAISAQMHGRSEADVTRVVAITGLLARLAFSDRKFQKEERALVTQQLETVKGLSDADRKVILGALTINADTVTEAAGKRYAAALAALKDKDLCLEVLRMLVDVAAADGTVADNELWSVREAANDLGLSVEDFERAVDRLKS